MKYLINKLIVLIKTLFKFLYRKDKTVENKEIKEKENENIELKQQIPDNTKGEGKFIIDSDKLDISECLDDNSSEIVAVLCDDDKSNSNILNLKEANDIESNINRKNTDTKLEEIGDVIEINKISGKVVEQNFISEFDNLNVKQNINNQPSLNEARYENVNKSNDFIIGLKEQNINKSTTL